MKELDGPLDQVSTLRQLFGDNRAEWPPGNFSDLFVPPTYLRKLESARPSILVGGRGTGKTTVLQSLRYSETLERIESQGRFFSDQEYLGILVRMNKNRVHAFKGSEPTEINWEKAFAHYFNLLACQELTKLALWLESKFEKRVSADGLKRIGNDLGLEHVDSLNRLQASIVEAISKLQIYVNNPNSAKKIIFSIPESPLRTFVEVLQECDAIGERIVFCCIDEYENLLDYQQGVINTYIKHACPPLTYKIGVRKYGIRNWNTTDQNDLLSNPDDFDEIEIADEGFDIFATSVANKRLQYAKAKGLSVPEKIDQFLVNMTHPEEAMVLGADVIAKGVLDEISKSNTSLFEYFATKPAAHTYFLRYWQEKEGEDLITLAADWQSNEDIWQTRLGNHGYASLFWISKGRKGLRIKKYYSGTNTMLALSGGNIRYFLQLIETAIFFELSDIGNSFPNTLKLSPQSQTLALRHVGKTHLDQLEGLAQRGVQLKRLVLAIGKVFFELARTPANRSPEVNSFVISGNQDQAEKINKLLLDGVGHLAFEISPRTKPTSNFEIRDNEFRLHRIFSGFFEISYRKKRRATFKASHLLEVVEGKPSAAISALLKDQDIGALNELPEQLAFFSAFYSDEEIHDQES